MQAVLECDVERSQLIAEEAELVSQSKPANGNAAGAPVNGASRSQSVSSASAPAASEPDPDPASSRLQQVYARLQEIDADGAPARAASILAGLSFDEAMQKRATKTFSGGAPSRFGANRLIDAPAAAAAAHVLLIAARPCVPDRRQPTVVVQPMLRAHCANRKC